MDETHAATIDQLPPADPAPAAEAPKKGESPLSFAVFLLKLAVVVLIVRSFVFAPFSIPSESMLPLLMNGDHLIASKWNYGLSNNSLPFGIRPFPDGRLFAGQPERGDVAIFKHPLSGEDYIKRVIGLPGDQIQMKGGALSINGEAVTKEQVADFEVELSPNTECHRAGGTELTREDGVRICRYRQFRETLPNGVSYNVLDFGPGAGDDTQIFTVPQGHFFAMGDNRDNSRDSRWPALPGEAVGMVPQDLLVGKAQFMMWSTDGGAEFYLPWTWFSNTRWGRIGSGI
jgi:signal peptidase I